MKLQEKTTQPEWASAVKQRLRDNEQNAAEMEFAFQCAKRFIGILSQRKPGHVGNVEASVPEHELAALVRQFNRLADKEQSQRECGSLGASHGKKRRTPAQGLTSSQAR